MITERCWHAPDRNPSAKQPQIQPFVFRRIPERRQIKVVRDGQLFGFLRIRQQRHIKDRPGRCKGQAGTLPREQAGEKTAGEPWTVQRAAQQWAGVTLWPKYCGWLQVNSGVTDWKVRPGRWWGEESYREGEATDRQIVTDRVSHTWSVLRMQIKWTMCSSQ